MRLKAGDTPTIPSGWIVTIDDNRVTISHPNYVGESLRGFSWYQFISDANEAAQWPESRQGSDDGEADHG